MIVSRRIRFPKSSQHPFETLKGLTNFLVSIFILSSLLLSSVPQTSKDIQLFSAFFYFWFRFALLCSDPQNRSHISTLHHQKEWLARRISHQQTLMWKPSNPIKGQIPLVSLHNTALVLCAAAAVSHPLGNFIRIYIDTMIFSLFIPRRRVHSRHSSIAGSLILFFASEIHDTQPKIEIDFFST